MSQQTINCPKCGAKIEITEVIAHEIEERLNAEFQSRLKKKEETHRQEMQAKELEFQNKLITERKKTEEQARKKAEESINIEISDLKEQLKDERTKREALQREELVLRKQQRELEDSKKNLELEMMRKLDEEREKIEGLVAQRIIDEHRLKDAEKDKKLADALKQVDELKRKMEQGSQKTQGEVLELELEAILKKEFPFDDIEPVSSGVRGADILQIVKTQSGRTCGKILWEIKRTRAWSDSWIQKLKDDQREAKAGLAVLVSEALPQGFHHFRQMDGGVWVTDVPSVVSLAIALRVVLVQVANAREAETGKKEKMELIYAYLTGPEFKNRVSAIIEAFRAMNEDLESEKRAMQRIWERRAKQIEKVISNTSGMYGDLEGLAGSVLPSIKILELPGETEEVS
ncbi:MAG: DUF2130 domain-containing protein [Candidatus Omnitrophica bacterium]|nr:DUF2130 domain-containing protein [Candidatus Omnitrophota bacterium]